MPRDANNSSEAEGSTDADNNRAAPGEAVRDALSKFGEMRAYAHQYVSARLDATKLTLRKIVILMTIGLVGLFGATAAIVIALFLLLTGLAQAIGEALGGRLWAGNLIVGASLVFVFSGGAAIALAVIRKTSLKKTVAKYELKQTEQRQSFGRSSGDRTAAVGKVEL